VLPSAGRQFNVAVDPTGLAPGQVHVAYVCGVDTDRPEAGNLFKVPITVVAPSPVTLCPAAQGPASYIKEKVAFIPGHIERSFMAVPPGCTWAEIKVTASPFEGAARLFYLACLQNLPQFSFAKTEQGPAMRFPSAGEKKVIMRVEGGTTLEVTLAQFWSSLGATECTIEVTFHGVNPDCGVIALSSGCPIACVHALSGPGAVDVKPSASLSVHRTTMRPTSSVVRPCGERDLYPGGKQVYELVMEYSFKLEEDGEATPQALLLNDKLYESIYESQLVQVYDSSKKYVGCTDCWPVALKLKKGEHVARLQVRHDDTGMLEKLKGMPLSLDRPLGKEIAVNAYPDFNGALKGSKEGDFGTKRVKGGVRTPIFFALAVDEKLPDSVKPGDQLLGAAKYCDAAIPGKFATKHSRGGFTVQYAVAVGKYEEKKKEEDKDQDKSPEEKYSEARRKAALEHLGTLRKIETEQAYNTFLAEVSAEWRNDVRVLSDAIKGAQEIKPKEESDEELQQRQSRVIAAADALIAAVNLNELAAHMGRRIDPEDKEAVKKGEEFDAQKDALLLALGAKTTVLADVHAGKLPGGGEECIGKLQESHKLLGTYTDLADAKQGKLVAAYEKASGRPGLALAALNAFIAKEDKPGKALFEERAELLEALEWPSWAEHQREELITKYPANYTLF